MSFTATEDTQAKEFGLDLAKKQRDLLLYEFHFDTEKLCDLKNGAPAMKKKKARQLAQVLEAEMASYIQEVYGQDVTNVELDVYQKQLANTLSINPQLMYKRGQKIFDDLVARGIINI